MSRQRIESWENASGRVTLWWEADRKRYVVERFVGRRPERRVFSVAKHGNQTAARRTAKVYGAELSDALARRTTQSVSTMSQLWAKYEEAMASGWRPATRTGNAAKWRLFLMVVKPETDPELITADDLDRFHRKLRERGKVAKQVRGVFALIRAVFKMAGQRRWVQNVDAAIYTPRISKDEATSTLVTPAEYSPEEWRKILAALNPRRPEDWRCWVAMAVEGLQGHRIQAVRHLRWRDIDLDTGVIHWPAEFQKQGKAITQPILPATRQVLEVAAAWRAADSYTGQWVLYRRQGGEASPVTYQTIHYALCKAEDRAKVPHRPYRATHGGRKMSGENVWAATKDLRAVGAWLGDRDLKQLRTYLLREDGLIASAADALSGLGVPNATQNGGES
jgi:integrase